MRADRTEQVTSVRRVTGGPSDQYFLPSSVPQHIAPWQQSLSSFRTSKPPPPWRFSDLSDGAAYLRGRRSAVHSEETRTPQHASRHTKILPPRHYANGASGWCLHDFTSLISITRFSSRCRERSVQLEYSGCGKFIVRETNCCALRKNPPGKFIVRNVTR